MAVRLLIAGTASVARKRRLVKLSMAVRVISRRQQVAALQENALTGPVVIPRPPVLLRPAELVLPRSQRRAVMRSPALMISLASLRQCAAIINVEQAWSLVVIHLAQMINVAS
jgi:hypothetical protein